MLCRRGKGQVALAESSLNAGVHQKIYKLPDLYSRYTVPTLTIVYSLRVVGKVRFLVLQFTCFLLNKQGVFRANSYHSRTIPFYCL